MRRVENPSKFIFIFTKCRIRKTLSPSRADDSLNDSLWVDKRFLTLPPVSSISAFWVFLSFHICSFMICTAVGFQGPFFYFTGADDKMPTRFNVQQPKNLEKDIFEINFDWLGEFTTGPLCKLVTDKFSPRAFTIKEKRRLRDRVSRGVKSSSLPREVNGSVFI